MRTCYVYMSVVLIALAVCVESQTGAHIDLARANPCEEFVGTWNNVVNALYNDRNRDTLRPAELTSLQDYEEQMTEHCVVTAVCETMQASDECKAIRNEIQIILRRHGPAQTTPTPTASSAAQLKHRQLQVLALGLLAVLTHVTQPL